MRNKLNKAFFLSGLLAALLSAPVFADEAADVGKLMRAGQYAEALAKADAVLAQRPKDAQMRFMKGVILTEQGKSSDAIAIFTKLTEDFPDLPEPYNNLAVLHAAGGQYDKARAALDMAIRTNPSYATAYENLGDIHAKLASQAYDKALQLDSGNAGAKSKLTLLRSLAVSSSKVASAKPTTPAAASVAAAKPAASQAATQPATQVAAAKPEPKAEPKPAAKPEANDAGERDDVLKAVQAWASAWSAQDVKGYLGHYASDFQTPKGESRSAWAEERRARIAGKGRISVKVESPQVSVDGNTATVKFRQIYVSDRLKGDTRKTLVLVKHGGKWQIKQERAGS
ncbi:MAG: tetratricopeptide repeat protein [Burkholderiales bacterium]|nr:tetratricopeptide repeat protein [Burkholderiales bacterium]